MGVLHGGGPTGQNYVHEHSQSVGTKSEQGVVTPTLLLQILGVRVLCDEM